MGPLPRSGERSRLPLRCQRHRHLLRHLRLAAQPRRRLRRHLSRYPSLRRPFHRHLVETRRGASLGPGSPIAGFGGLRRQQQLHFLGLEDRNSGAGVQCLRLHRYHRSLSHRCLQMESHRASPVLRDFQKLGCRAPGQLRQNAQLHSHYQHPNRLGCHCLSGPKRVSDRSQTRPVSDLLAPSKTQQHTAEMELHHCTESVGLLLRRPLATTKRAHFLNLRTTSLAAESISVLWKRWTTKQSLHRYWNFEVSADGRPNTSCSADWSRLMCFPVTMSAPGTGSPNGWDARNRWTTKGSRGQPGTGNPMPGWCISTCCWKVLTRSAS